MISKALLWILKHDVLGERFMDDELTGTDYYALTRAYNKLSANNDALTRYEYELVERAVKRFRPWYNPVERAQIDADMTRLYKAVIERMMQYGRKARRK